MTLSTELGFDGALSVNMNLKSMYDGAKAATAEEINELRRKLVGKSTLKSLSFSCLFLTQEMVDVFQEIEVTDTIYFRYSVLDGNASVNDIFRGGKKAQRLSLVVNHYASILHLAKFMQFARELDLSVYPYDGQRIVTKAVVRSIRKSGCSLKHYSWLGNNNESPGVRDLMLRQIGYSPNPSLSISHDWLSPKQFWSLRQVGVKINVSKVNLVGTSDVAIGSTRHLYYFMLNVANSTLRNMKWIQEPPLIAETLKKKADFKLILDYYARLPMEDRWELKFSGPGRDPNFKNFMKDWH